MKALLLRSATALLLTAVLFISSASAQGMRVGPHGGVNFDGTEIFVGAGLQFPLALGEQTVWGNVGLDLYPFISKTTLTRLNLDALLPLAAGNVQFYFGGGLVAQFASYDLPAGSPGESSDTDLGINVKGGVLLGQASSGFRPFVELNQTIGAGSDFGFRGGLFLRLGGVR